MRRLRFKRGRRRTIRRSAAALATIATLGLLSDLIPSNGDRFYGGLVISEASAQSKKHSNKGPHFQKLQQAAQQMQALQQAAVTQSKLQQIQTMVAAQQKHVQNVQNLVAAHKQKILQASQPPIALSPAAQPPKLVSSGHHQAIIKKALAQVQAAKSTTNAPIAQKVHALIAKAAKNQAPQKAHPGQHHNALIKAALHHSSQQKMFALSLGKQQTKSQVVYQHIAAKLKGHGHGFGGPHVGKHKAVFQHIFAKLSAAKNKQQPAAPAAAPAPAPTTTSTSTTTKKTTTVAQAILPVITQPTTGTTTVVAAVASAVKGNSGNDGGEPASSSNLLGTTISKLGGPKQPDSSSGSGGGGRATNKNGNDDDDDAKDGGIVSALRNGAKPNPNRGGAAAGGLNLLASAPTVGTYVPKQVLAVNLNPAGLKKVLGLNFKVKETYKLGLLGVTITKLEAPTQDGALPSLGKLAEAVADSAFALNRVYVPYRLGASGSGMSQGNPLSKVGCNPDRCFGSSLINWRPSLSSCAQDVKIGIIDTGIDEEHPAIKGGPYKYKEFVPSDKARASQDHGTGVYSLLAGRPESSTPGLAPRAVYSVANAFYAEAKGGPAMSETVHMLAALDWLDERGVQIINLSFSGPSDPLVHRAIKRLERKGVIVVAAAGNDGPSAPPTYPAAYDEVVAVTAVDRNLAPYRYANRGDHISIAAPGVGIWTALADSREGPQTGTSFAAPYVTGVLALNHAVMEGMDGSLSPKERALRVLNSSAMKLGGPQDRKIFGAGLVRAPDACPSGDGTAVAQSPPAPAAPAPAVVKASSAPSLVDWFKGTTVRATGN